MKRLMQWVMAAALICGTSVFSSCSKDDNPVDPADKLSEKIIGKWISTEMDGRPLMTNSKAVFTFVSATKVYMSTSINKNPGSEFWGDQLEGDVVIDGNKITITNKTGEQMTTAIEFIVTAINKYEFFAKRKMTVMVYDKVVFSLDDTVRYAKVNVDYSEAILGTWEGKVTSSEGSEFDDGETHRWEYKADGTYVYYEKDGDDWVPYKGNTLNEYFVDGTLLCTRWIDNDVENREWWEIASIKDGVMKWKGLRQKEDGTTYTATFEMKKVE